MMWKRLTCFRAWLKAVLRILKFSLLVSWHDVYHLMLKLIYVLSTFLKLTLWFWLWFDRCIIMRMAMCNWSVIKRWRSPSWSMWVSPPIYYKSSFHHYFCCQVHRHVWYEEMVCFPYLQDEESTAKEFVRIIENAENDYQVKALIEIVLYLEPAVMRVRR